MAENYQEGDIVQNDEGHRLQLKGGQWVNADSYAGDMVKAAGTGAERVAAAIGTFPYTATNMLAKGVNAAGNYFFPDWQQSFPGKVAQVGISQTEPQTYSAAQQKVEALLGHPLYNASTVPGKMIEAAVESAPFGLPEAAAAPSMARALLAGGRAALSGGASEGAGQATQGTVAEIPARLMAGTAAYAVPGAGVPGQMPATARAARAETLHNAGVPVSAADITGSRLMATLEGRPPAGQSEAVSSAVQRMGGVPLIPGDTRSFEQRLANRRTQLQGAVNALEQGTSITPSIPLSMQLRGTALQALNGAKSPEERNAIVGALNEYNTRAGLTNPQTGLARITGQQYNDMRQRWRDSGVPALREMAGHLDNAMEASTANGPFAGMWPAWRQHWADLQGLEAASGSMGGNADVSPLSVGPVLKAMHARTPMRDVAYSSQAVLGNRPAPYEPDVNASAGLAALVSGAAGHLVGGGPETGIEGAIFGGSLPYAAKVAAKPIQAAARSVPGQNLMLNMDPRTAALLLANQGGVVAKQKYDASQPPQNTAQ